MEIGLIVLAALVIVLAPTTFVLVTLLTDANGDVDMYQSLWAQAFEGWNIAIRERDEARRELGRLRAELRGLAGEADDEEPEET